MVFRTSALYLVVTTALSIAPTVLSLTNYANEFVDPKYVLAKNYNTTTLRAQQTILNWANEIARNGPWSVTNKPYLAPSGNKHDYMSWAPYYWPDCSQAGNTTELTPEQVWTTCNYVNRDGQLNPEARTVKNIGDFDELANAVLYNSLAWGITGSELYSTRVAGYIRAWFLDEETYMNPNLNYAQMQRGPNGQNGSHTGILDLKCMAKIASGVLLLRQGSAPGWTSEVDTGFVSWTRQYIGWLTTAEIALEEKAAKNNHGSFYFNQLAALQVIVDDLQGAAGTVAEYFATIYKDQIDASGDQPLESARTRPYHYLAYNLAAMITNARIGEYAGYNAWQVTTNAGANIQKACDYAMTYPPRSEVAAELYPYVAAVGAKYGDPQGVYTKFLDDAEHGDYVADANFFWNQPLDDRGYAAMYSATALTHEGSPTSTKPVAASTGRPTEGTRKEDAAFGNGASWATWVMLYLGCGFVTLVSSYNFF